MKSFVTGGAGFLGSAVVSRLVARGDEVVGLARSDESATKLTRLGALPVRGEITDARTLDQLLIGVDLVFHIAGDYRVGIKEADHEEMFRTNVDGTIIVLDAAVAAAVKKIVYVSTVGVFGNTRGKVVDETYERPDRDFLSYYDATKYMAHRVARARAAAGAPIVVVQPGAIYGPGDHSELGAPDRPGGAGQVHHPRLPRAGLHHELRGRRRRRRRAGADRRQARRVLRAGRRGHAAGHDRRHRRRPHRAQAGAVQGAVDRVQGGDARRVAGGTRDGDGPEPARGHPREQGRHLLGDERQGRARAGVRAARAGAGPARPARGGADAPRAVDVGGEAAAPALAVSASSTGSWLRVLRRHLRAVLDHVPGSATAPRRCCPPGSAARGRRGGTELQSC